MNQDLKDTIYNIIKDEQVSRLEDMENQSGEEIAVIKEDYITDIADDSVENIEKLIDNQSEHILATLEEPIEFEMIKQRIKKLLGHEE